MTNTNYYTAYADHMWRFYIRNQTTPLSHMHPTSQANWSACHKVYTSCPPDWHAVLSAYYGSPRKTRNDAIRNYCASHNTDDTGFFRIIHTVQTMAAVNRGLVEIDGNPTAMIFRMFNNQPPEKNNQSHTTNK